MLTNACSHHAGSDYVVCWRCMCNRIQGGPLYPLILFVGKEHKNQAVLFASCCCLLLFI